MIRASFDKGHKHRSEVSFDIDHTDMVRPSRKRVSESMRMPPWPDDQKQDSHRDERRGSSGVR
jgi:hypothetical protein